jgi:hypothetical protein
MEYPTGFTTKSLSEKKRINDWFSKHEDDIRELLARKEQEWEQRPEHCKRIEYYTKLHHNNRGGKIHPDIKKHLPKQTCDQNIYSKID